MNDSLAENEGGLSRVEQVYRTIRKSILSNHYPPGYQALEPEIAKQLGVSRTPVREALIRLEADKLIELIPRRGMRVLSLIPKEYIQICQVITTLAVMAVELLAAKKPGNDMLAPMEDALREMDLALKDNDLQSWSDANEKYHRFLGNLSGNARLAGILETLRAQTYRSRMIILKLRTEIQKSNDTLRILHKALLGNDPKSAGKILLGHEQSVIDESVELIERFTLSHL